MNTHGDFEEFLKLLNEERVEYVIVGGYAVVFHGYIRATNDMDVFFRNTADNIQRMRRALERFGFSTGESAVQEFGDPGVINSSTNLTASRTRGKPLSRSLSEQC